MNCSCGDLRSYLHVRTPCPVVTQRACHTDQKLHVCTHHLDGLVTVQIQLPLLTAKLVLQLEPGIIVVVWANFDIAAEPVIQHAHTPDELLELEIIEEVISSHRHHTVPNRIVSTTRKHPPPHNIATQTPRRQSQGRLPTKRTESRRLQRQRWYNHSKGQ